MADVLYLQKPSSSWEKAMESFLWFKQAQGLSQCTLNDYRRHITTFFKKFPSAWPDNLRAKAIEYMAQKVAPATYNLRFTYLSAFFRWCVGEGLISQNPLAGFKKRFAPARIVNIELKTLKRLLALPDKNTYAGLRDYALLLLTLDTGIRPSEALALGVEDVNLSSGEVYVRPEVDKTRIGRTLPLSPATVLALRKLISARHPQWGEIAPLFSNTDGQPLTRSAWQNRIQSYSRKLKIKIRPYDLRHAFALNYLRSGGSPFALQRILGHRDMAMTKRYIALTLTDLHREHKASPVAILLPKLPRVRKVKIRREKNE